MVEIHESTPHTPIVCAVCGARADVVTERRGDTTITTWPTDWTRPRPDLPGHRCSERCRAARASR